MSSAVTGKNSSNQYSYKGWLLSENILKRSFAVLGHNFIATAILWITFMLVFIILYLFGGI